MSEIVNTATIRVVADSSGVEAGLRQGVEAARQVGQEIAQVGAGATASSRNVESAGRSIIGSIQRTTAAMEAGGRATASYYETLARQRGVDPATLTPYLNQLRAVEQAQRNTGQSAAQTAAALRTVPAQFTDIVTALQGGQQPLTVLLQQGGQLRDQFGSTGAAARALGGYIVGLVNPYTVAAAAAVALAVAYKTGAEEASAYAQAIALSGNAAGATVDQLSEVARQIGAVSGSQGAAAEALTALVSTGQVSVDNLRQFGAVAADVQKVLGRSVADTAAEFAELGRSPLTALDKINEKYHFITSATYAQVKALQDQGRAAEAADLAQRAYAEGIDRQRQKVLDSLTDWERGWIRIKGAVSGAVDSVLDFAGGRDATSDEKIKKLLKDRDDIQANLDRAQARGLTANVATYQAELDANQRAINVIREKAGATRAVAKAEADAAQVSEARNKWLAEGDKYLTRAAQLERDLTRARNEGAAAFADKDPVTREKLINERLTAIRKSYSDIFNAGIESNIAALKRRDQVADVLEQRELARIQAQRALGSISEVDAINATAKAELDAFDRKGKLLEAELAQTKRKANSAKELADLQGQIAVNAEQRRNRELKQEQDLLAEQEKRRQASEALYIKGVTSATAERDSVIAQVEAQFQYNQEIGLSTNQVAELRAARLSNAAALKDESAAALEAIDPASELAAKYREQAQALRDLGDAGVRGAYKDQMIGQWKQAVDQYGQVFQQGFADMLNNGQAGWQSFTKSLVTTFKTSVADQIYKMFARPIIVQLVGSYLGVSQQAIAGEIASQPNAYGVTASGDDAGSAISAAQAASTLYKAINGGFNTLSTGVADAVQAGLEHTGLSGMFDGAASSYDLATGLPVNGSFASGAGSIAANAGGVLAGHYIGNAIAGDYSVNHGQAVTNIASVVGAVVGGPIGAAIGGAIGGLFNRAFGMGPKEATATGISGVIGDSGSSGQAYAKWKQDGGWFRSDRSGVDGAAFGTDVINSLDAGLAALKATSAGFAQSLGLSADSITYYAKTFDIATGKDKDIGAAVAELLGTVGDELANKLVPNLKDFARNGETAATTLERLAGEFKGTDQVAQLLGVSADQLFGSTGLQSASAREQLIDVAGGLSVLNDQAAFFNQNFLTDAERIKPVAEALDKALAGLGLETIPATREQFKGLVNSLIASGAAATESGAKQLESLLALGQAFAQVHPDEAEKAAKVMQERQDLQGQLDELTMSSTELLAKQRAALDESNRALFDQVQAVKAQAAAIDAVKANAATLLGGVDSAFSALQKVVGREKAAVQQSIEAHTASVNKLKSLSDSLRSTLDSLKSPDQKLAERTAGQAQIRAALAIAKAGGVLPDADSLKDALGAVTQDASSQFSSYTDYLRDLYQTQNDIAALGDITDDQLSVEQKSLDALQGQLKRLDDIVANGQAQIDALNGESVATLSLAQAMGALSSAIGAAKANPVIGGTSSIADLYQQLLDRAPDSAGLKYWQDQIAGGMSLSQIEAFIKASSEYAEHQKLKGIPGFAGGGLFGGGLRIVGENGPELEATGPSRIWSSNQTAALLARAGSGGSDALVQEVKALRVTAERQQAVIERQGELLRAIAGHTSDTATHLDDVVNGRKPIPTESV